MLNNVSRRALLKAMCALAAGMSRVDLALAAPAMTIHRDPGCGCCEKWAAHIRGAGIPATIVDEADISAVKRRLGVPASLASCHTAEIDGYVVEGHVPAFAIFALLRERPSATGLAAPGMPEGSPGMETGGRPESFEVLLFGPEGVRSFGRYRGAEPA